MSERIRGSYDDELYKSTYILLYPLKNIVSLSMLRQSPYIPSLRHIASDREREREQYLIRSSDIAEGPHNMPCQLKSFQLLHSRMKKSYLNRLAIHNIIRIATM